MSEFFAYENIKELVVYIVFIWIVCLCLLGYSYWIVTLVKWAMKKLKSCFDKKKIIEEKKANE